MATIDSLRIIQGEVCNYFEFSGEFSTETGKQCIDAMVDVCRQSKISKALLDCRSKTLTRRGGIVNWQ
jgi:hypothetical protein